MILAGHSLQNGRYVLMRFVRAGGAGVVWAAQDRRPRKGDAPEVAIKVLDAAAGGADAAAREAEVAARVRHPSVVRVRDTFVEDGLAFMVMDLARCSLADLVAQEGPLPPPVALGCALQACAALAEAHRAGVVHRDVKPHNLLVFGDGSVRLGDFGAARALMDGHTRTRTGALLGSIPFMAPEQRRDPRAVRPSTDVYGLAVTLAWLLLGEAPDDPWTEEAAAQLRAAGTPDGLVRAIATGGARRAEERPQDAAAYLAILEACGVVAGPLAQNDMAETSVDRHGSGEMSALVRGVEQLWAGGSRPPQRPPVAVTDTAGPTPWTARRAWAVAMTALLVGAGVGVTATLRDEVRQRFIEESPEAQALLDWARLPTCAAAGDGLVRRVYPNATRETPTLREALPPTLADVDMDGAMDMVVSHTLDASIVVWWGPLTDDGWFAERSDYPTVRAAGPVAVGDLDGDGDNDLVHAAAEQAGLAVQLLDRRQAAGSPRTLAQDADPWRVAITDWDHDGHNDLVVHVVQRQRFVVRTAQGDNWAPGFDIGAGDDLLGTTKDGGVLVSIQRDIRTLRADRSPEVFARTPMQTVAGLALDPKGTFAWGHVGGHSVAMRLAPGQPCRQEHVPDKIGAMSLIDAEGTFAYATTTTCAYCTSSYELNLHAATP